MRTKRLSRAGNDLLCAVPKWGGQGAELLKLCFLPYATRPKDKLNLVLDLIEYIACSLYHTLYRF